MTLKKKPDGSVPAPLPPREGDRVAALRAYDVLDTLPEVVFDDLTFLASHICQVPIALVSLVDSDRQWFKSRQGLEAPETHRDLAFCAHAILQEDTFVVPNALADARFAENPLVTGGPEIRFYAGVPLVTPDGHAVGTLCAIDRKPRQLTADQDRALKALAREVMMQLELRSTIKTLESALRGMHAEPEAAPAPAPVAERPKTLAPPPPSAPLDAQKSRENAEATAQKTRDLISQVQANTGVEDRVRSLLSRMQALQKRSNATGGGGAR